MVRGITADPIRRTYWIYTDQAIFELGIKNEDRDVWKINLEKGQYDVALQYAKVGIDISLWFRSELAHMDCRLRNSGI